MKLYKAKSLKNAEKIVRNLRKQIRECLKLLDRFYHERKLMAKLAADSQQFSNPLVVAEAKQIRDRILRSE